MRTEKSDIKFGRRTRPVMGNGSRIIVPKDYCRKRRDRSSSDCGFRTNFRESSNGARSNAQTLGKWLQALDLPCDSHCLGNEDLMLSEENAPIRRRNSLDDKDLVHEFVQNGGLECMIKLGRQADQNHQNYILRALGQVMLYVDGMNGIIAHIETIQWLYELLDSPYRLVVKTALKLLLVFIEYTDHNALLLMTAVTNVDKANDRPDWFALMRILNEKEGSDVEMLTYGMTIINKTLNGVADQ
ncbi:unnamed protein product, partial [Litomosoides sigmodontis]